MIQDIDSDDGESARSQSSRRTASSRRTEGSQRSTTSSAAILARAKAQALRARVDFVQKEAELRRKEEDIARALLLLNAEKEYAMAEAEAEVLETAAAQEMSSSNNKELPLPSVNPEVRTTHFVEAHFKEEMPPTSNDVKGETLKAIKEELQSLKDSLQTRSPPQQPSSPAHHHLKEEIHSISNMLFKKDLVKSGLRKFRGLAGEYRAWKSSFQHATQDLDLKPFQETTLILDSLEGRDKNLAERICASHVDKPDLGLQRIWAHLDRKHGSPEAVEWELMQRVDEFPKIAPKDGPCLEDFGYLLQEVQYTKETGQYPGLLVLDSSRGLQPLIAKLPEWLQMKWREKGSQYKDRHAVIFPPFEVFVGFIQAQARIQNDPSFRLSDTKAGGERQQKQAVTVRMTGVTEHTPTTKSHSCPIHHTAHELQDCRAFKERTPEDKIAFLKEKGLCFRCLKPNHLIGDCKAAVKCEVCGGSHVTAMHRPVSSPDVPVTSKETPSTTGQTEGSTEEFVTVAAKCTRVCGQGRAGRSCAKICLAKVYLPDEPERAMTTYVLIDDQSDGSLVSERLLDSLNVKGEQSSYALKTISGLQEVRGRNVKGLIIESLDGSVSAKTPTLYECNNIPGDVSEIPTPEVAAAFDHLKPIASMLPPLKEDAEIGILLGRDAPQFHKVRDVINGADDQPWAHRLDLGWVVIGEVGLPVSGTHIRTDISHLHHDVASTCDERQGRSHRRLPRSSTLKPPGKPAYKVGQL